MKTIEETKAYAAGYRAGVSKGATERERKAHKHAVFCASLSGLLAAAPRSWKMDGEVVTSPPGFVRLASTFALEAEKQTEGDL